MEIQAIVLLTDACGRRFVGFGAELIDSVEMNVLVLTVGDKCALGIIVKNA